MKKLLIATALITALSGCMVTPTLEEADNNYITNKPLTFDEMTPKVLKHLRYTYFDPESILIEPVSITDRICVDVVGLGQDFNAYTIYSYRINAKNRYGGYTGWKTQKFAIHNGSIKNIVNYCWEPLNK